MLLNTVNGTRTIVIPAKNLKGKQSDKWEERQGIYYQVKSPVWINAARRIRIKSSTIEAQ